MPDVHEDGVVTATCRISGIGTFKTTAYATADRFGIEMFMWGPWGDSQRAKVREVLNPKLQAVNEKPCFFHNGERWMRWGISKDPLHFFCVALVPISPEHGLTPEDVKISLTEIKMAMFEHWSTAFCWE
jgi:hypothetical protein